MILFIRYEKKTFQQKIIFNCKTRIMQQYGKIRIDKILWIQISLQIITPLITLYVAVTNHEVKPFPYTTITGSACPYPQNILFRFIMLISASILSLIFFIIFKWLINLKQSVKYPGNGISYVNYYIAQFSVLCYSITIGTIDANGTGPLHGPCAVIFFLIQFYMTVKITLFLKDVRNWDTSVMSKKSWFLKKLTCFYLAVMWIICVAGILIYNDSKDNQRFQDILQWNDVIGNLLWLLSFHYDWKGVYLCLKGKSLSEMSIDLKYDEGL